MANPSRVTITKDTWTKIASGVLSGNVFIASNNYLDYLIDFRTSGSAAPSDDSTGIVFDSLEANIHNSEAIDVYIKCKGKTGAVIIQF